jgi:hypothetical protein
VRWHEMELHLSHAWGPLTDQIFGLENQGSFTVGADLTGNLGRAGGALGGTTHAPAKGNPIISAGLGGINLAAVGIKDSALVQSARVSTGTYKRTLDAQVAEPVSDAQWQALQGRLQKVFPDYQATELLPDGQEERLAQLHALYQQAGPPRRSPDPKAQADVLNETCRLWQQEQAAMLGAALVIPGARIELNVLGRSSLEQLPDLVVGHLGLRGTMNDVAATQAQVPGLQALMRALAHAEDTTQVRYVFEMKPQSIARINDGLMNSLRAARNVDQAPGAAVQSWASVVNEAVRDPDLYRLAAIALHNTDDNPSSLSLGLLGTSVSRSATASKQLFQAEIQVQYAPDGTVFAVEALESASRAVDRGFEPLRQAGLTPLQMARLQRGGGVFGPESPRAPESVAGTVQTAMSDASWAVSEDGYFTADEGSDDDGDLALQTPAAN